MVECSGGETARPQEVIFVLPEESRRSVVTENRGVGQTGKREEHIHQARRNLGSGMGLKKIHEEKTQC